MADFVEWQLDVQRCPRAGRALERERAADCLCAVLQAEQARAAGGIGTALAIVANTDVELRDHPRLSGFFAASDLMALGAADAVRAAGRTGQVKIIGLDGIPEALQAIRVGSIDATVSQYPYVMGQMAVEACVAAVRGSKLPTRVDAPIAIVTRANARRAMATFPHPFQPYSDPFKRILKRH